MLRFVSCSGAVSEALAPYGSFQLPAPGQITGSSNEVTLASSYFWAYTRTGLNSGFGIVLTGPTNNAGKHESPRKIIKKGSCLLWADVSSTDDQEAFEVSETGETGS